MWPAKFVREVDVMPWGYGFAYRSPQQSGSWCWPIPLNWIVKGLREVWIFMAMPPKTKLDYMSAYKAAWLEERKRRVELEERLRS